jgi:ketosteroid isomerase-like protein
MLLLQLKNRIEALKREALRLLALKLIPPRIRATLSTLSNKPVTIARKGEIMRNGFLCLLFFLAFFGLPRLQASSDESSAVERVLRTQQEAWNRHDLDGFMAGYWNSPDLTFFSSAKQTSGWQATIDRYRATYDSPGHEMGKLEFSGLRIEMLGPDSAFVRGAWHLTMSDGKTPHGLFTLMFRKFPDGWKIIHDHTSVAE